MGSGGAFEDAAGDGGLSPVLKPLEAVERAANLGMVQDREQVGKAEAQRGGKVVERG